MEAMVGSMRRLEICDKTSKGARWGQNASELRRLGRVAEAEVSRGRRGRCE